MVGRESVVDGAQALGAIDLREEPAVAGLHALDLGSAAGGTRISWVLAFLLGSLELLRDGTCAAEEGAADAGRTRFAVEGALPDAARLLPT